jgi:hypothetical protein
MCEIASYSRPQTAHQPFSPPFIGTAIKVLIAIDINKTLVMVCDGLGAFNSVLDFDNI